jgi:hypothetical protein
MPQKILIGGCLAITSGAVVLIGGLCCFLFFNLSREDQLRYFSDHSAIVPLTATFCIQPNQIVWLLPVLAVN